MGKPTDLVQGTLDLLILKTLVLEPMHGWGIAQRIRQVSKEVLQVNQGALYPALHRLEQSGWIRAKWGESDNNRRAKFYSLTPAGRKYLEQEQANWERISAAIGLFSLLGMGVNLGRTFQPGEDRAGRDRLVILSHGLWQNKFQGDPGIIGRVIRINGVGRQVVGVMPPGFSFLVPGAQLWIPLHFDPASPVNSWERDFTPDV